MVSSPRVAGDEDDGQVGELGYLVHELDPVGVGQHQVEQNERGPLGPDQALELGGLAGRERGVAGLDERVAHEAQGQRVVVDHEDARALPLFRGRA